MTSSAIEPLECRIAPAVFTVTTLADTGTGSLRQALSDADAHSGADTIIFHLPTPPAHGENIITLASALTSKGDVTITGPGAGRLIINANGNGPALTISDGSAATDSPATISGLTLTGGHTAGDGAGIFTSESLTLKGVTISGCQSSAGFGGGLAVQDNPTAHITITGSTLTGNSADENGGNLFLLSVGTVKITHSTISGGLASHETGGGAYIKLASDSSTVSISGSAVTGNVGIQGAGLEIIGTSGSKIAITGSVISGNDAIGTSYIGGGGLYLMRGNVTIASSVFSGNSSGDSGGGLLGATSTSMSMSRCVFSGNSAQDNGSGFDIYGQSILSITGTVVSGNHQGSAGTVGGGAYIDMLASAKGAAIASSKFIGNTASHGGGLVLHSGVSATSGKIAVAGTLISGNVATATSTSGGAGLYIQNGNVALTGTTISSNDASGYNGGGLQAGAFYSLSLSKCIISGNQTAKKTNTSAYVGGAGLYLEGHGTTTPDPVTITSTQIVGNSSAANGGGILASAGISLSLTSSSVSGNYAIDNGAGIRTGGSGSDAVTLTISKSKITGNSTSSTGFQRNGTGISAAGSGALSITSSSITGNAGANFGGGLFVSSSSKLTIQKSSLSQNFVTGDGGGLFVEAAGAGSITATSITGNLAGFVGGGAYIEDSPGFSVTGTLITANTAVSAGGGIHASGGAVTLEVAKVFANSAPGSPDVQGTTFNFV